jgi:hypothetical protein
MKLAVRLFYDSTTEAGYSFRFFIDTVLEGPVPILLQPGDGPGGDGVLLVPPWSPEGKEAEEHWGLGAHKPKDPTPAVLTFADTQIPFDQVEPFTAGRGRGLGDFLPPGTVTPDMHFIELLAIEWTHAGTN